MDSREKGRALCSYCLFELKISCRAHEELGATIRLHAHLLDDHNESNGFFG
jgi:hypothetical protein